MPSGPIFSDRVEAGRALARQLTAYARRPDVLVFGLPRGGVPVAYEVATALEVPWDVFIVRKLGVPGHEELAMGAIASGGIRVLNRDLLMRVPIPMPLIEAAALREQEEIQRRETAYRGQRPPPGVEGRTIILIDDGLATGSTMRAAAEAMRSENPAGIVVAVPVASAAACGEIGEEVDHVVCAATPEPFDGVGRWYADFSETTDEEVKTLLARSSPGYQAA